MRPKIDRQKDIPILECMDMETGDEWVRVQAWDFEDAAIEFASWSDSDSAEYHYINKGGKVLVRWNNEVKIVEVTPAYSLDANVQEIDEVNTGMKASEHEENSKREEKRE